MVAWLASLVGDVAITSVTLAELLAGVGRLPDGRRKTTLLAVIEEAVEPYRDGRSILAFDDAAARQYAQVLVVRDAAGLPISTADAQIAAICRVHHAALATRNLRTSSAPASNSSTLERSMIDRR